jgi:drug/metabolite transporter (DMT)-like permease
LAVILFRRSGETVAPYALNVFRVGLSSLLLLATLLMLGLPVLPDRPATDYLLLVASGAIGIVLSDTLFHRSLNIVGAGINAIVDCLFSPFTALLALLLLGETLSALQLGGMGLVIGAVALATHAVPPPNTTRTELVIGILWGVAAMLTLALGLVLAKPVLTDAPVLWVVVMRQLASLALMIPIALVSGSRREILAVFRPKRDWRFIVPGTLLGSYLALMLWLGGMKYTLTGAAAVLNQTATIFILVFAAVFLKEPFTRRRVLAAGLAFAGIVLVTVG